MPQATEELRDRIRELFGDSIDEAGPIEFLEKAGYKFTRGGVIIAPNPKHEETPDEMSCIRFLIDEWDYGYAMSIETSSGVPDPMDQIVTKDT
jgi:hypothetical protein